MNELREEFLVKSNVTGFTCMLRMGNFRAIL